MRKGDKKMDKKKLLLIDDDRALGEMLTVKLEKAGNYDVKYSPDANRVVELAQEVKPDLIILDIDMPDTDGGDACKALEKNKDTEAIPVLFLSSLVTPEGVEATGGIIGEHEMASKKMTIDKLIERIQTLL
jgi:DNA-binding response OmpR family regulator